jgi:hypothetical protein
MWISSIKTATRSCANQAGRPDVVVTEEFTRMHDGVLRPALAKTYPRVRVISLDAGVAVYSRFAIRDPQWPALEMFKDGNRHPFELDVCGHTVVLYALHLQRPGSLEELAASHVQAALLGSENTPVNVAGDLYFTERTPNAALIESMALRPAYAMAGRGLEVSRPWKSALVAWREDRPLSIQPRACLHELSNRRAGGVGSPPDARRHGNFPGALKSIYG